MSDKKYFVTTAIDYVNDVIHIGHAYEKILADCYVRHLRGLYGEEKIYFLTGTDEHGQKVQKAAEAKHLTPQQFADEIAKQDETELRSLHISFDQVKDHGRFFRTTDEDHTKVVEAFWKKVQDAGYIYEGEFTGLYCEGDEAFLTESDIVEGKCPNHPNIELKTVTEKNYFFKWSAFQDYLQDLLHDNPDFVPQEKRRNEMLAFLDRGLEDITISRRKDAVSWGIAVPGDPDQVIYVWFDALINYLTYGTEKDLWNDETQIVHFVGKDILRWHALLWPAMLKAAGYKRPNIIVAHGFLGLNGQKISKSIGNVIRPSELVEKYGVDPVRYYLLRYTRLDDDADLDLKHFEEVYNADLANKLGNLVSRVAKLCESSGYTSNQLVPTYDDLAKDASIEHINAFAFSSALEAIWSKYIDEANQYIDEHKPWELQKSGDTKNLSFVLERLINTLLEISVLLSPFVPETSSKIIKQFSQKQIKAEAPLFPRI